jgi:hypothetical protein
MRDDRDESVVFMVVHPFFITDSGSRGELPSSSQSHRDEADIALWLPGPFDAARTGALWTCLGSKQCSGGKACFFEGKCAHLAY